MLTCFSYKSTTGEGIYVEATVENWPGWVRKMVLTSANLKMIWGDDLPTDNNELADGILHKVQLIKFSGGSKLVMPAVHDILLYFKERRNKSK